MSSVELAHGFSTSTMPAQPFRASRFPDVHHLWGMPRNSLEETKRNLKEIMWGLRFPCGSAGKESACSVRPEFNPWVGKIPWKRERLSTPVFWPGEFHGLYSPWSRKESDTTEHFHFHLCEVWLFLCSFNLFFHRPPNQNFCFSDRIMY